MLSITDPAQSTLHGAPRFRLDDPEEALAWLARFNLGMLVTASEEGLPRASSTPVIVRREEGELRVYGHLARKNPQIAQLAAGRPLLYTTQGPTAYVSPAWFPRRPAAPSYLHITIHAQGHARMIEDPERAAWVLLETVAEVEGRREEPWAYDGGEKFLNTAAERGISAFELELTGIEGAVKLNQDRSEEERELIAAALASSPDSNSRAIAELIRATNAGRQPVPAAIA